MEYDVSFFIYGRLNVTVDAPSVEAARSIADKKVDEKVYLGDYELSDYRLVGLEETGNGRYNVSYALTCLFDVRVEADHEGDAQREAWNRHAKAQAGELEVTEASIYKVAEVEEETC